MNILIVLGAVLIGLSLGLLGSGGSIITVPLLIYVADEPAKLAIAESLFIVGCISAFGSLSYIKRGLVSWKFVMLFGVPSMFGTYLGAWTSQYVSGVLQLLTFSIVMLIASRSMFSPLTSGSNTASPPRKLFVISAGILVGALAGFVGVGGGFLIVPALFLLGKLDFKQAIGSSLIIITMQSLIGYLKYQDVLEQFALVMNWKTVAVIVCAGILGSMLGVRIADKIPQQKIRKLFALVLVILGIYILGTSIYDIL
ncbi:sulfite exporter TauE/SafE family protein [Paraglaciecola arctica]|uniref:Probable membrane transporter protein n=1 Tax=Paraglaciecola arctica BSs20135 TaxID=493475 RepID=K6Y5X7_9ALTE|nr:sulfite exporter TauE/SafE family protein [Paraglaciecola arctica]GAC19331.1 hypothetical protein GARC_2365 [Paraglaciecola arctica BSs20135]